MKPEELHAKQGRSNLERLESMSLEEIVNSVIPDLPGDYKTAACRLASDAISYEREIERLREALKFYADPQIYENRHEERGSGWIKYKPSLAKEDRGERARRALDGDE